MGYFHGHHGLFHLYISVNIMHQRRHGLFHLYISVILCTKGKGATGYFTFILVLYYAPEAPRVISGRLFCELYVIVTA